MVALVRQETVADYAMRNNLSESTVYRYIKEGMLKAEKVQFGGRGYWYWLIETKVETNELYPVPDIRYGEGKEWDVWGS
jgi:hypothetical protein